MTLTSPIPPTAPPAPPPHGAKPALTEEDLAELRQAAAYANPGADCDLIMKGGITSGVVYPLTACQLAKRYRFRRLGGASAGAIAATFAAAAELGRHHPVGPDSPEAKAPGFVGLQALPDEMGRNLAQLFQPTAELSTAYRLLLTWIEPGWSVLRRAARSARLIVAAQPLPFFAVAAMALVPAFAVTAALLDGPQGTEWVRLARALLVFLPGALVLGLVASAALVTVTTMRRWPRHGFGLCNGHTKATGYNHPPLTDWMSSRLNTLAGREPDAPPLTFGDLWGARATKIYRCLRAREETGTVRLRVTPRHWSFFKPHIDVLVMTTALTFGRPYQFPFSSRIFLFCRGCLAGYFPEPVIKHLVDHSSQSTEEDPGEPAKICPEHGERVRSLPEAPDIPVVLAARFSLSFPLLISAVPLYTVDRNRGPGCRGLVKVWFSDGGIASNFPMHFFDSLWPERPTFGINLADPHPDQKSMVWRPRGPRDGLTLRSRPIESVPQFVGAMIGSMQNWADNSQLTLPGFRDRVVEVRTTAKEGGLNLTMPPDVIRDLSRRGAEAAVELNDFDFELHRWIRYRVSMGSFTEVLSALEQAYGNPDVDDSFANWLENYEPASYALTGRGTDIKATAQLVALAKAWRTAKFPALNNQRPHPIPRVRQTPPL